jgi:phosphatidylserine/phosphatidylglycerophosphate/cardiolipin synthase-like enzyme
MAGLNLAVVRAEMLVQACFSPEGECSGHILNAVDGANREILVAMYAFTSGKLARALVRARDRGVEVRVILDFEFDARSDNSVGSFLAEQGVPVETVSGLARGNLRSGLMHQKFVVVDRVTVASGSYNWTHAADDFNHESLLIFRDAGSLAGEFRAEFLRLWNERK